MMKVKWIQYKPNFSCSELAKRCLDNRYSESKESGFVVSEYSDSSFRGQHISRRLIKDVYEAPFGDMLEREIVSFDIVRFEYRKSFPDILRLEAPPRKLSNFYADLRQISGISSIIHDLVIDPMLLLDRLDEKGYVCTLISAEISDINIGNVARASMSITGVSDIQYAIEKLTFGRKYSMRRARYQIQSNAVKSFFTISANGNIKIDKGSEVLLPEVEEALFR